jgi:hypothetical protein
MDTPQVEPWHHDVFWYVTLAAIQFVMGAWLARMNQRFDQLESSREALIADLGKLKEHLPSTYVSVALLTELVTKRLDRLEEKIESIQAAVLGALHTRTDR